MIRVCGPRDTINDGYIINTTSRANGWSRGLSPFILGPVELWTGNVSWNVENAWQYSKVYAEHVRSDGWPSDEWFLWAREGQDSRRANRYPMGKGAVPLYSYWDGLQLSYIDARKAIYCPLYYHAVRRTHAFNVLQEEASKHETLYLWDFDGYDHVKLGMTYDDVINDPTQKMGHAFVLAMMLDGKKVWEDKMKELDLWYWKEEVCF